MATVKTDLVTFADGEDTRYGDRCAEFAGARHLGWGRSCRTWPTACRPDRGVTLASWPTDLPTRPARTCASTPTTRSTGTSGATLRWRLLRSRLGGLLLLLLLIRLLRLRLRWLLAASTRIPREHSKHVRSPA